MISILFRSISLYVTSVGLSIICYGPFRSGCNFLENPFCVVKFGIKTYVPIFKFVAGVNWEFIWELIFFFVTIFLLLSGSFR